MRNIRKVFFKKLTLLFSVYLLFFQCFLFSTPATQSQSEQKQKSRQSRRAKKILDAKKKQDQQVVEEVFLQKQTATKNQKSKKSRASMAQVFTPQKASPARQVNAPTILSTASQQIKPVVFQPVKMVQPVKFTPNVISPEVLVKPILTEPTLVSPVLEQPTKVVAPAITSPVIAPSLKAPAIAAVPAIAAAPIEIAELKTFDHVVVAPPFLASPEISKIPDFKLELKIPSMKESEPVPDSIPPYDGPEPIKPRPAEKLEPLPPITPVSPPSDEPKESSYLPIPDLNLNVDLISDFEKVGAFDTPLFLKKTDKPILGKEKFDDVKGPKPFGPNPNNSNPPKEPQIRFGVLGGRTAEPEKVIDPGIEPEKLRNLNLKALIEVLPSPAKVTGNPGDFGKTITIDIIPKVESILLVDKSKLFLDLIEIYKSLSSNHQKIQKILRTMSVEGFPEISLSIGAVDGVFKKLDTTAGIQVNDKFSFGGQLFQTSSIPFESWNTWCQLAPGELTQDNKKHLEDLFNIVFSENSYNSAEQYLFSSKTISIPDNSGGKKTLNQIIHTYGSVAVYSRCVIKYCLGLMCLNILKKNSSDYRNLPTTVHSDLEKTGNELSKKIKRFFDEQNKLIRFGLMTQDDAFILQKAFLKSCIFGLSGKVKNGVKRLDWTLDVSGHLKELFWKKKVLLGKLALINSEKNLIVLGLIQGLSPKIDSKFSNQYYEDQTIKLLKTTINEQVDKFSQLKDQFGLELSSVDCNISSIGEKIKSLLSANGTSSQKLIKILENIKQTLSVTIPESNDDELRIIKTNFNLIDPSDKNLDAKKKIIPNSDPQDPKVIIQSIQNEVLEEYKKSISDSLESDKTKCQILANDLKMKLQQLVLDVISEDQDLTKQFDEAIQSLIAIEEDIHSGITLDFKRINSQLEKLEQWITTNSEVIKTHRIKFVEHKASSERYKKGMKNYAQLLFKRLKSKISRGTDLKNNWITVLRHAQSTKKYEETKEDYDLSKAKYEKYKQELLGWQSDDENYKTMLAEYNSALNNYESAFEKYENAKSEYETANQSYVSQKAAHDAAEEDRVNTQTHERAEKVRAQDDSNELLNQTWAANIFQKNYRKKISGKKQSAVIIELSSKCKSKKQEIDQLFEALKKQIQEISDNQRFANQDLVPDASALEFDGRFSQENLDQALLMLEKAQKLAGDKIRLLVSAKTEKYGQALSSAIINYLDSILSKIKGHNNDINLFLNNSRSILHSNQQEATRAQTELEKYNKDSEKYQKYLTKQSSRDLENQKREDLNALDLQRALSEKASYEDAVLQKQKHEKSSQDREELIKNILEKNMEVSISNQSEIDAFKSGINSFILQIKTALGSNVDIQAADLIGLEEELLLQLTISSLTFEDDIQKIKDIAKELGKLATEFLQKKGLLATLPTEKDLGEGKKYVEKELDVLKINIDGLSEHLNEINSKFSGKNNDIFKKIEDLFVRCQEVLGQYSILIDLSDDLALGRREVRIIRQDETGDALICRKNYEDLLSQFYSSSKKLNSLVARLQTDTKKLVVILFAAQ